MFAHILVPIDLGDRNARALRTALELARRSRTRVTLLHVVQSVPNLPPAELSDFYARLARAATRKLESVARRFAGAGVRVRTELCVGEPAREIVRAAARRRADLVVLPAAALDEPVRPGGALAAARPLLTLVDGEEAYRHPDLDA